MTKHDSTTQRVEDVKLKTTVHLSNNNNNLLSVFTPITTALSSSYIYQQLSFIDSTIGSVITSEEARVLVKTFVLAVVISVALVYITSNLRSIREGGFGSSGSSRVIIVGPQNSGKTLLFNVLQFHRVIPTVTSTKPNIGKFVPAQLVSEHGPRATAFEFVDVPGHPSYLSIQQEYISQGARAVMYVVDNKHNATKQQMNYVANDIYNLLCNQQLVRQHTPFLLVINQHADASVSAREVLSDLESAIETMRHLDNSMSDISDSKQISDKQFKLGKDTPFTFRDSQMPVTIEYVNAAQRKIDMVSKYLSRI